MNDRTALILLALVVFGARWRGGKARGEPTYVEPLPGYEPGELGTQPNPVPPRTDAR